MSRKANPTIVGAFVVGGLALLLAGIILLASGRWFRETSRAVVYFRQSVDGLRVGAAVTFKGIQVGTVRDISINLSQVRQRPDRFRIPVVIELDQDRLSAAGALVDLDDPGTLSSLIQEGLRAQLGTASLLTGLRYVALDLKPGTNIELAADPTVHYPEIPSLPSPTEELPEKVTQVVDQLARTDFPGLVQSARELTDGAGALVTAPELVRAVQRMDRLTASLDATILELRRTTHELGPDGAIGRNLAAAAQNTSAVAAEGANTAARMGQLLHPDGAFFAELEATLTEIHAAARSLRRTADQLSRDPGAMLRGGRQ